MQEHILILFLSAALFFLKEVEETAVLKELFSVHLDIILSSSLTPASILTVTQMNQRFLTISRKTEAGIQTKDLWSFCLFVAEERNAINRSSGPRASLSQTITRIKENWVFNAYTVELEESAANWPSREALQDLFFFKCLLVPPTGLSRHNSETVSQCL